MDSLLVRIQLPAGKPPGRHDDLGRKLALAFASLLTPTALLAVLVGTWVLATDLSWTDPFPISEGWLSRWHTWLGGGFALRLSAYWLQRYGRGSGE